MTPMHVSWQTSAHKNVACYDCHAEAGFQGTVKAKAKGLKELYLHVTAANVVPKASERDINCYSCHQDKVKMNADKAAGAKDPHTFKHFGNGMTCVTCHGGLVHNVKLNNAVPSRDTCSTCHLDAMKK
jgi:nitrate/TMAO reductase-like tetraheme cytochrome c subunit